MVPAPRSSRGATLATIASTLGISRTTVSNAYNRPDQLSAELRAQILQTARKLGYGGPNPVARSLRTRKAGALGLLLTEELDYAFRDPAALAFLGSLAGVCESAESGLMLLPGAPGLQHGHEAAVIRNAAVDGVVLYSMPDNDPGVRAVLARGIPTVVVDGGTHLGGAAYVGIDNVGAMVGLARHIAAQGHRRIGVVSFRLAPDGYDGPASLQRQRSTPIRTAADRLLGLAQGLSQSGVDWTGVAVEERAEHSADAGSDAAAALLRRDPDLTAILCLSDVYAEGVLRYARSQRIDVPGQLAVSGFDGLASSRLDLTTVRQPFENKGRLAGEALLAPEFVPDRTILPTELVLRGSTTGPPREGPLPR